MGNKSAAFEIFAVVLSKRGWEHEGILISTIWIINVLYILLLGGDMFIYNGWSYDVYVMTHVCATN